MPRCQGVRRGSHRLAARRRWESPVFLRRQLYVQVRVLRLQFEEDCQPAASSHHSISPWLVAHAEWQLSRHVSSRVAHSIRGDETHGSAACYARVEGVHAVDYMHVRGQVRGKKRLAGKWDDGSGRMCSPKKL